MLSSGGPGIIIIVDIGSCGSFGTVWGHEHEGSGEGMTKIIKI